MGGTSQIISPPWVPHILTDLCTELSLRVLGLGASPCACICDLNPLPMHPLNPIRTSLCPQVSAFPRHTLCQADGTLNLEAQSPAHLVEDLDPVTCAELLHRHLPRIAGEGSPVLDECSLILTMAWIKFMAKRMFAIDGSEYFTSAGGGLEGEDGCRAQG